MSTDKYGFKPQGGMWSPVGYIPVMNDIAQRSGFYLSYDTSRRTTAICGDGGTFFLVLNGDHRAALAALSEPLGLALYFADNICKANEHSEHLWACGLMLKDPLNTRAYALKVFTASELDLIALAVLTN